MRTSPTVRTMNPVNKADRKRWEVRLGPVQAVILIGGVLGCMAASWHLGAYSGQHVGFDKGRSASVSDTARLPIFSKTAEEADSQLSSEDFSAQVFAKLEEGTSGSPKTLSDAGRPLPKLGTIGSAIKASDESPIAEILSDVDSSNDVVANAEKASLKKEALSDKLKEGLDTKADASVDSVKVASTTSNAVSRGIDQVLGQSDAKVDKNRVSQQKAKSTLDSEQTKTLGALVETGTADSQAVAVKPKKLESKSADTKVAKSTTVKHKLVETDRGVVVQRGSFDGASKPVADKKQRVLAAQKPAKPTRQQSAFMRDKLVHGWYAQIAAPEKLKDADVLARRLKNSGFPVAIQRAEVRGQVYYRVLVGAESTRAQANELLKQLKRETYVKSDPFLKYVKR